MPTSDLLKKQCKPCEPGTPALSAEQTTLLLADVPGWELAGKEIVREFKFADYYETMAFVNAVAWTAHQADHHPDMEVSYDKCRVRYSTHSVGGLSENDFICAAKVNALI